MKTIENIRQLEPYGIDALTGESDSHCYRCLCDLTARGKGIIERTLGLEIKPPDSWNGGTKDDPHVGSCLIPYEFVPCLAAFALLSDTQVTEVWLMKSGTAFGFGVEDVDQKDALRRFHGGDIRHVFYARSSDRNLHQFTGRTV